MASSTPADEGGETEASAATADFVRVTVITLGGEAALQPTLLEPGVTVGELLGQLRGPRGAALAVLQLFLGGRQLAAHERLGDLEASSGDEAGQGLELTLLRRVLTADPVAAAWLQRHCQDDRVRLHSNKDVGEPEAVAIACLLLEPGCTIRELDMRGSSVKDISPIAEALRTNATVVRFWLHATDVADVSVLFEALRENRTLQELVLDATYVTDVSALAEALRVNTSLVRLSLAHTKVEHVGGLADALRATRTLKWISLEGCPLPSETVAELRALGRAKAAEVEDFAVFFGDNWW